jgi:hypothetical protein
MALGVLQTEADRAAVGLYRALGFPVQASAVRIPATSGSSAARTAAA